MTDGHTSKTLLSHLNESASVRPVNNIMPIYMYQRSAGLALRQAEEYRRKKRTEQEYVMLLRFVNLVLHTIPEHVDYKSNNAISKALNKEVAVALTELEKLKKELKNRTVVVNAEAPFTPRQVTHAVKMQKGHVPGLHWDRGDGKEEIRMSQEDLASLELLGTDAWDQKQKPRVEEKTEKTLLMPHMKSIVESLPPDRSSVIRDKHMLMSQMPKDVPKYDQGKASVSASRLYPDPRAMVQLGPQELRVTEQPMPTEMPRPGDSCSSMPHPAESPVPELHDASMMELKSTPGMVEPPRAKAMRDVHISCALMDEFLRYAVMNTRKGIETCGILAGKLSTDEGTFVISALIVPKQEGTTDTVTALAEEEIFEAQDSRSLYPLGWIHTHPTQTCFLSSVDVHTQCGYQTMLDEAIAIVMAPTDANSPVGIFRLTTPGGLKLIQNCPLRGFHTHPPTETGQQVYELCNHVYLNSRIGYEVIDLR